MPTTLDTRRLDISRLQRRALTVLSAGQILGGVGMGAAFALGSLLVADVAGSNAVAGLAATMTTLGAAITAIPLARIAGVAGRRRALAIGTLAAGVGALAVIAFAAAHSFAGVLAGLALVGTGSAVNLQTRFAAADLAAEHTRGRDLSLVIWATTVGVVAGPNLAAPGDAVGRALGLPPLTGAFALTILCQVAAAALYLLALRPDPLAVAKAHAASLRPEHAESAPAGPVATGSAPTGRRPRFAALGILRRNRAAAAAVVALALSHTVMVSVMAMTPVHLADSGASVTVIGLTISAHTAGMYLLSPVFGSLADRFGRGRVVLAGQALLVASLLTNWFGQHSAVAVTVALTLLGLGWSAATIAGSTMLTESVTVAERTSVQGTSDSLMNLCGAGGGALAGVVLALAGYGSLNLICLIAVAVVAAVLLPARRAGRAGAGRQPRDAASVE